MACARLLVTLPLVLGLVALGGGDDQTFADGAMLGVFYVILVGLADVVTRLVADVPRRRLMLVGGYVGLFALWHVLRSGDLDVWPAAAWGAALAPSMWCWSTSSPRGEGLGLPICPM